MRRSPLRFLACAAAASLVPLAACGSDSGGGGGGAAADAECPLGAIDEAAGGPVEITFWHSMPRANEEALQRLTDAFNASQDDVVVSLVNQVTYKDTFDKYRSGLASGQLPDLVQLEDTTLQQVIDTQSVLPAQACIDADDYDLTDFLPAVVDYWTVDGTMWPMPWNVSSPVLYYEKGTFGAAGLDPEDPPATLDEVREYSQQIVDSGAAPAAFGLKIYPWLFEQYLAKSGEEYVNNGNGRDSRATAVAFDDDAGQEYFAWSADMVDAGLAVTNPAEGPSEFDNLLGIRNRRNAMTVDTSAALGTIQQVIASGEAEGLDLGVAPMPGPDGGGVSVGGAGLYIVNESSPAKQEAAWRFTQFLNEPDNIAQWAADTGYLPTRLSSPDNPIIQELWSTDPEYKVAYDQLLGGEQSAAASGPVIGDAQGVRDAVVAAQDAMFAEGADPADALAGAKRAADTAMTEYNDRLGV